MEEVVNKAETYSYLSFKLGEEMFAADVRKVLEILELRPLTKVPKSPDYMRGVINLRGNVLPVLDTKVKFGMPLKEDSVDTCIVVLNVECNGEKMTLGAIVDAVEEVLEISDSEIEPPPTIGNKFNPEYMRGMIKLEDHFIMILNIDKVFNTEELIISQEFVAEEKTSENNSKKSKK